ncbi:MAG: MaoC/PaaZ C-terminal domain-containing protein [Bacillota bacterium]
MLDKSYGEIVIGSRWVSRARTITEADVVNFSGLSGDWYPLHTDREYAAGTVFGQRIAHGMLVLSVSTGLLKIMPGSVEAFYGMDEVRFMKPVFFGDTIHVELHALEKTDRSRGGGILTLLCEVKNQKGDTVVTAKMKMLMK